MPRTGTERERTWRSGRPHPGWWPIAAVSMNTADAAQVRRSPACSAAEELRSQGMLMRHQGRSKLIEGSGITVVLAPVMFSHARSATSIGVG